MRNSSQIVLSTTVALGSILILGAVGLWWLFGGRLWISSGCPKGHLATIDDCKGKSEPGWQNSGAYYLIASGRLRSEFCNSFTENYSRLESTVGRTCTSWTEALCSDYPHIANWRCFSCDRMAINGNTHYYFLAAVSPDCSHGIYFSGSQHQPKDLAWKIRP